MRNQFVLGEFDLVLHPRGADSVRAVIEHTPTETVVFDKVTRTDQGPAKPGEFLRSQVVLIALGDEDTDIRAAARKAVTV